MEAGIVLDSVSKAFSEAGRRRLVLDRVDLRVAPGERLAITGRSGAGKSTLLNLLGGMDTPDSGMVAVAGTDLGALDERGRTLFRRRRVGFVFQFFNLIPTLSVGENLSLPLELLGRAQHAEERSRALLQRLGLEDRIHSFPDRLSGGEQQRVALARALIHEPELILADEPTGNLDAESGRQVMDLLCELGAAAGRSLVLVTHSPELAGEMDRVVELHSGGLQAVSGSAADPA